MFYNIFLQQIQINQYKASEWAAQFINIWPAFVVIIKSSLVISKISIIFDRYPLSRKICTFWNFVNFKLLVNLCTIGYGLSVGWMASAFLVYDSDNCPLPSGRVPIEEIAWAASILGIGGLLGTVAVGWIADRVGRKNSLLAMAVPQIVSTVLLHSFDSRTVFECDMANFVCPLQISYLLIIYAQNVYYLYTSRFLTGFVGGAVFVVIPIMVAEIAEDR